MKNLSDDVWCLIFIFYEMEECYYRYKKKGLYVVLKWYIVIVMVRRCFFVKLKWKEKELGEK